MKMVIQVSEFSTNKPLDHLADSMALQWDTIQPVSSDVITFDGLEYKIVERIISYSIYHARISYEVEVL